MKNDQPKILLVEDNESHLFLIKSSFENSSDKYFIQTASNINEANKYLRSFKPNLIISDLKLPDGNGIELLKNKTVQNKCPVIIMTSQGDEQAAVNAIKSGALDYIIKTEHIFEEMPHIARRSLREWKLFTEHKISAEALKKSEEKFSKAFNTIPSMLSIINMKNGKIFDINETFIKITGYKRNEIINKTLRELNLFENKQQFELIIDLINKKGKITNLELIMKTKNGETLNVTYLAEIMKIEDTSYIVSSATDITELKKSENARKESDLRFRLFMKSATFGLSIYNSDLKLVEINETAVQQFSEKINKSNLIGMDFFSLFPSLINKKEKYFEVIKKNKPYIINNTTIHPKLTNRFFQIIAFKVIDGLGIIVEDITKKSLAEKKLKHSLTEKEILLKEIHHRVKNNFQIISSILNLQSLKIKDKEMNEIFSESQNRIRAMALIHENLYKSKNLSKIDFNEYINKLIKQLFRSYGNLTTNLDLKINVSNFKLSLEKAIPCGLILNELISNSIKHAFPNNKHGTISIDLIQKNETYNLKIADNGIGIKKDLEIINKNSLGLQLVELLVEQIEGTLNTKLSNGTMFDIIFKN